MDFSKPNTLSTRSPGRLPRSPTTTTSSISFANAALLINSRTNVFLNIVTPFSFSWVYVDLGKFIVLRNHIILRIIQNVKKFF